jgi:YHS domain-containing protein
MIVEALLMRTIAAVAASAVLGWIVLAADASAQQKPEIFQAGQQQFGANLAVSGFDTVAYHTQNLPVPGTGTYRVSWKGAEWRFATQQNRDLFVQNPERYAPQFGGYCAFAVAFGTTTAADPRVFAIRNGKLYLNLNASVQSQWTRDQDNLIRRAEQNWPRVLQ